MAGCDHPDRATEPAAAQLGGEREQDRRPYAHAHPRVSGVLLGGRARGGRLRRSAVRARGVCAGLGGLGLQARDPLLGRLEQAPP